MASRNQAELLAEVDQYYTQKITDHGATPLGVDWNSRESQELRFAHLRKIIGEVGIPSVNDFGCGYGHLFTYLEERGVTTDYLGIDISQAMITAARSNLPDQARARFIVGSEPDRVADYSVASGIFNVRLDFRDEEWWEHIVSTIDVLASYGRRGFAFNCLTAYSDSDRMRPDLYYARPESLFEHCIRRYSRNVALLHDYGLFEFTILVRKEV